MDSAPWSRTKSITLVPAFEED